MSFIYERHSSRPSQPRLACRTFTQPKTKRKRIVRSVKPWKLKVNNHKHKLFTPYGPIMKDNLIKLVRGATWMIDLLRIIKSQYLIRKPWWTLQMMGPRKNGRKRIKLRKS